MLKLRDVKMQNHPYANKKMSLIPFQKRDIFLGVTYDDARHRNVSQMIFTREGDRIFEIAEWAPKQTLGSSKQWVNMANSDPVFTFWLWASAGNEGVNRRKSEIKLLLSRLGFDPGAIDTAFPCAE